MTRKQWLKTFLHLADSGAAAVDYRKKLRIKTNVLGKHINKLGEYRKELTDIIAEEERIERRRWKKQQQLLRGVGNENVGGESGAGKITSEIRGRTTATPQRNPEAMGPREDNSED